MNQYQQQLINDFFTLLGFGHAQITITQNEDDHSQMVDVQVPRQEAGMLIGYQGEKIDSIRRVLNLMVNHDQDPYLPLQLNVNDYHQQREDFLKNLADEAAEKALDSHKEILLPPLSSFERRLVHLHLSNNSHITTYSEGEGNNRRLVVQPKE